MIAKRPGLLELHDDRYFQHLDIRATIEQYGNTRLGKKEGREYHGICPYPDCGSRDNSFWCWEDMEWPSEHWGLFIHWKCRKCGRKGTVVDLVRDMLNIGWHEARKLLGVPEMLPDGTGQPVANRHEQQETPVKDWQIVEWTFLDLVYPLACRILRDARAQLYLKQRSIDLTLAEQYGLAYLRPLPDIKDKGADQINQKLRERIQANHPQIDLSMVDIRKRYLARWFDGIIYPVSVDKRGTTHYQARTLRLWVPGMTANEHKEAINRHNALMVSEHGEKDGARLRIERYLKTYKAGFFNAGCMREHSSVVFVEGVFDALTLLMDGRANIVDIGGIGQFARLARAVVPASVKAAQFAFDYASDGQTGKAMKAAANYCRFQLGIEPSIVEIPDDGIGKDWNDRYIVRGHDGLLLLDGQAPTAQVCITADCNTVSEVVTSVVNVPSPDESRGYIPMCWSCNCAIDEFALDTWRLTPTGTLFCVGCWSAKRLDLLPAHLDIEMLAESFLERPCAGCGGHDWLLDPEIASDAVARSHGFLICPCLLAKRDLAARPRPTLKSEKSVAAPVKCPHCEKAGRLAYGVKLVTHYEEEPWRDVYKKTPGKPFYYVKISDGSLMCPGCQDRIEDHREIATPEDLTTVDSDNPEFASAYRYIEEFYKKQS